MKKAGRRDGNKEQHWRDLIAGWRKSGLQKSEFCRQEGVRLSYFCTWESIIRQRDEEKAAAKQKSQATKAKQKRTRKAKPAVSKSAESAPSLPNDFVRVQVKDDTIGIRPPSITPECMEICLPSGVGIKLPLHTDTSTLLAVLAAIGG
jgi:hypothetical protein